MERDLSRIYSFNNILESLISFNKKYVLKATIDGISSIEVFLSVSKKEIVLNRFEMSADDPVYNVFKCIAGVYVYIIVD